MHNFIYSLRTVNGRPTLDYSLGLKIVFESPTEIRIELPTGIVTINKRQYLNTMRIYDDGVKTFFYVCTKAVDAKFVFKRLLGYSVTKIDRRVEILQNIKTEYMKEMQAA